MKSTQRYPKTKRVLDMLMLPIMYLLQGNFREVPQRTHVWNRVILNTDQIKELKLEWCYAGHDPSASTLSWIGLIPRFHMPLFGGWKTFIVLEPTHSQQELWHVGWILEEKAQLSSIPIDLAVRVLLSSQKVYFFGIDFRGEQIPLKCIGRGRIGKAGVYADMPLL